MTDRRSIIVTGCSSGIGAWCARALASDGWRVFATVRRVEDLDSIKGIGPALIEKIRPLVVVK